MRILEKDFRKVKNRNWSFSIKCLTRFFWKTILHLVCKNHLLSNAFTIKMLLNDYQIFIEKSNITAY